MTTLSNKMVEALNHQIEYEGYASSFYLSLAYLCDDQALVGCKKFFQRQAEEERMHMLKIYDYLSDAGVKPETPAISKPPSQFEDITVAFEQVFEQERKVTLSINKIMTLAIADNDYATQSFLQWYIDEQREEESTIRTILDRIKLIGSGGQSLYYIDKEVDKINNAVVLDEANEE